MTIGELPSLLKRLKPQDKRHKYFMSIGEFPSYTNIYVTRGIPKFAKAAKAQMTKDINIL